MSESIDTEVIRTLLEENDRLRGLAIEREAQLRYAVSEREVGSHSTKDACCACCYDVNSERAARNAAEAKLAAVQREIEAIVRYSARSTIRTDYEFDSSRLSGSTRRGAVSQSNARRARRQCKRWGHDFVVKTNSEGRWVTLPCQRCGAEPDHGGS